AAPARRDGAEDRADRPRRLGALGLGTLAGDDRTGRNRAAAVLGRAIHAPAGRRAICGGRGAPPRAEGLPGQPWERPIARVRDTLTAVRALLGGERLPNPAPGGRPLRIGALPDAPVPMELAALSSASIRLAGELADAWTPFLWARSRLDDGRE